MRRLATMIVVVGQLIVNPVFAADLAIKSPPPSNAPTYNWTGCYVAGGAGYGLSDVQHYSTPGTTNTSAEVGGRGWLGRLGAGCDYQFAAPWGGNWLVGVIGDYDFMGIKGNYTTNCPLGCLAPSFSYTGQRKETSAGYIGARVGWIVTPQLLTYWDGGWTETHFNGAMLPDTFGGASVLSVGGQTFNGWFLGGGTEYQIGWLPGVFWRNEYRFSSYSSRSQGLVCAAVCAGVAAIDNARPYVQTVTTELVWRFNWSGARP